MDLQESDPLVPSRKSRASESSNEGSSPPSRMSDSAIQLLLPPADLAKLRQAQLLGPSANQVIQCAKQNVRNTMAQGERSATLPMGNVGLSCLQSRASGAATSADRKNSETLILNELPNKTHLNTKYVENRAFVEIPSPGASSQESTFSSLSTTHAGSSNAGSTAGVAERPQTSSQEQATETTKDAFAMTRNNNIEKGNLAVFDDSCKASIEGFNSLTSASQDRQILGSLPYTAGSLSLSSDRSTLPCQQVLPSTQRPLRKRVQGGRQEAETANLLVTAVTNPDSIFWCDRTLRFVIEWTKDGRLGITVTEAKGCDDMYAMVRSVESSSPAATSGIQCGDRLLEINGCPIHVHASQWMPSVDIIKSQDKKNPARLIVQRPLRVGTTIDQGRGRKHIQESIMWKARTADVARKTSDVRKASDVTRKTSDIARKTSDVIRKTSRFNYFQMNAIPDLRLVIMGSHSEITAEQIVGSEAWSHSDDSSIFKRCFSLIEPKKNHFEWSSPRELKSHQFMAILKMMEKEESASMVNEFDNGSMQLPKSKVLEVMAIKDSLMAQSCSQILMTSHCLYIVQFDGQSCLRYPETCLGKLQSDLDKIRTYAGAEAPIYLLSIWPSVSVDMVQSTEKIGNLLQERFGFAFGRQLQYHENCPCFVMNRTLQSETQDSHQSLIGPNRYRDPSSAKLRTQSSNSTTATAASSSSSMASALTAFSDLSPEDFLRDHIANNVCEQNFLSKSTAISSRFLEFRDTVTQMRSQHQKCVLTSSIKRACQLEDPDEVVELIGYLHKQGIIFSPAHRNVGSHHTFVVLDPMDLVDVYGTLLKVPNRSRRKPKYQNEWDTLEAKAILTPVLWRHLLGTDSDEACLRVCLQQLNLIHDGGCSLVDSLDSAPDSQCGGAAYFVPYFVMAGDAKESLWKDDPRDLTLFADFLGHCPHGTFSALMLQLGRIAQEDTVPFNVRNENAWIFNMGGKYSLYAEWKPSTCQIAFGVKCMIGYSLPNVLLDIFTALEKIMSPGARFNVGPPCPMNSDCMHTGHKVHVIPLNGGHTQSPLRCGEKDVRKYASVKQWVVTGSSQLTERQPDSSVQSIIREDTPYRFLPPDFVQMLCNKMNVHRYNGQDWRGLAGQLNYTYEDVQRFEMASTMHYDPCRHLLDEWGQEVSVTLRDLLTAMEDLGRLDVIQDLKDRWEIFGD